MLPSGDAYNVDWIFAIGSNVHVANDMGWFTAYRPFESFVLDGASKVKVLGVGTVELPVKTHKKHRGLRSHGTLVLHDVLYAPEYACNVLGNPILDKYGSVIDGSDSMLIDKEGSCVAVMELNSLYKIRLQGQRPGQSSLGGKGEHVIGANWPESERKRWAAAEFNQEARLFFADMNKRFLVAYWLSMLAVIFIAFFVYWVYIK